MSTCGMGLNSHLPKKKSILNNYTDMKMMYCRKSLDNANRSSNDDKISNVKDTY